MYLFFDVETTGLPKSWSAPASDLENWPRIVQIAWLQYDKEGNELSKNNYIVKPVGFTIPPDSTKIHGITTECAKRDGANLNIVLNKFSSAVDNSKILIAHNINFDNKVVSAEFLRENIPHNLHKIKKLCTMKESTEFCQIPGTYGYKWPNQSELHTKLFNVAFEDSHNALVDVTTCAKCFFELVRKGVIKP